MSDPRSRPDPIILLINDQRALRIVLGTSDSHERFRFACDHAPAPIGTLRELAQHLGVHPSALSRSNFTLTTTRRRQAALRLGVPAGFLARTWTPPQDLPESLLPLHDAITRLRREAPRTTPSLGSGWIDDACVAQLSCAAAVSVLADYPRTTVEALLRSYRHHARQRMDHPHQMRLPIRDWLRVIDALVTSALEQEPGNLQHPDLALAKRMVCQIEASTASP